MDDNQLDLHLKAYFKEKIPLDDSLVRKTKLRLQRKTEKKENFMLFLLQMGFSAMALLLGALVFVAVGFNTALFVSALVYLTVAGLVGTLLAFLSTKNSIITRRIEIYE